MARECMRALQVSPPYARRGRCSGEGGKTKTPACRACCRRPGCVAVYTCAPRSPGRAKPLSKLFAFYGDRSGRFSLSASYKT